MPNVLEVVEYMCFHKEKLTRKLRLRQKVGFLLKK